MILWICIYLLIGLGTGIFSYQEWDARPLLRDEPGPWFALVGVIVVCTLGWPGVLLMSIGDWLDDKDFNWPSFGG